MIEVFIKNIPPVLEGQKIGLFGGSFNPPHVGHVLVAQQAIEKLALDKVWWMVTPANPLKDNTQLPSIEERIQDSAELLADTDNIYITGFEKNINSLNSITTVNYIFDYYRDIKCHFVWLIGGDNLLNFHKWHKYNEIANRLPIAVIARPGSLGAEINSHFANEYRDNFIDADHATKLVYTKPPAWTYLYDKMSTCSSTKLRALVNKC